TGRANAVGADANRVPGRWPIALTVERLGVPAISAAEANRQAAAGLDDLVCVEAARLASTRRDSGRQLAIETFRSADAGANLAAAFESEARRGLGADERRLHLGHHSADVRGPSQRA